MFLHILVMFSGGEGCRNLKHAEPSMNEASRDVGAGRP